MSLFQGAAKRGFVHESPVFQDFDGSPEQISWIEDFPDPNDTDPGEPKWFGWNLEAGWIGPFETEEEAVEISADDGKVRRWVNEISVGQMSSAGKEGWYE